MTRRAPHPRPKAPRGSALVYVTVVMVALMAFASLAIDLGHVYVVRSELQLAADAAARYGVTGLGAGVSTAAAYALDAADDNKADGMTVVLDAANDIEYLNWNKSTHTYTVLTGAARSGANAMRVTARRRAADGNAVSLLFARVLGKTSQDVQASSIAYIEPSEPTGIIGYSAITLKNNAFIGAYNSAVDKNPTEATALSIGNLASNGTITGGNNNDLKGGITLGPGAPNASGIAISGVTTRLADPLVPPADPAWAPGVNPNGVPQNYTVNTNTTLPGGTYWFTAVTVKGSLTFTAPATLYVNGPILVTSFLGPQSLVPADLKIYQLGDTTFGDDDVSGMDVVADIIAPKSEFLAKNALKFRGRMIMKSIEFKNNADLFYDVGLGTSNGTGPRVTTVR